MPHVSRFFADAADVTPLLRCRIVIIMLRYDILLLMLSRRYAAALFDAATPSPPLFFITPRLMIFADTIDAAIFLRHTIAATPPLFSPLIAFDIIRRHIRRLIALLHYARLEAFAIER